MGDSAGTSARASSHGASLNSHCIHPSARHIDREHPSLLEDCPLGPASTHSFSHSLTRSPTPPPPVRGPLRGRRPSHCGRGRGGNRSSAYLRSSGEPPNFRHVNSSGHMFLRAPPRVRFSPREAHWSSASSASRLLSLALHFNNSVWFGGLDWQRSVGATPAELGYSSWQKQGRARRELMLPQLVLLLLLLRCPCGEAAG